MVDDVASLIVSAAQACAELPRDASGTAIDKAFTAKDWQSLEKVADNGRLGMFVLRHTWLGAP